MLPWKWGSNANISGLATPYRTKYANRLYPHVVIDMHSSKVRRTLMEFRSQAILDFGVLFYSNYFISFSHQLVTLPLRLEYSLRNHPTQSGIFSLLLHEAVAFYG